MPELTEQKEIRAIYLALERAKKYGLEGEVIYAAIQEIRINSKMTIDAALSIGLGEWDL